MWRGVAGVQGARGEGVKVWQSKSQKNQQENF